MDYLINSFDKKESSSFKKGQIGVCSEVLKILSHGLKGAGLKTIMNQPVAPENGSIMRSLKSNNLDKQNYILNRKLRRNHANQCPS